MSTQWKQSFQQVWYVTFVEYIISQVFFSNLTYTTHRCKGHCTCDTTRQPYARWKIMLSRLWSAEFITVSVFYTNVNRNLIPIYYNFNKCMILYGTYPKASNSELKDCLLTFLSLNALKPQKLLWWKTSISINITSIICQYNLVLNKDALDKLCQGTNKNLSCTK